MPLKAKTHSQLLKENSPFKEFYEQQKKQTQKEIDKKRGSAAERGYTSKWQKARAGYLTKHPLCQDCLTAGRTTEATLIHHIKPAKDFPELFWDRSNWMPLCSTCHTRRHKGRAGVNL